MGARLEHFTLIVRMYGFEGEAGREGEGFTRTRESSHRRPEGTVNLGTSLTNKSVLGPTHLDLALRTIPRRTLYLGKL